MQLTPFRERIWMVARPQKFWGVETGTRMTVVQLSDGGLFVHGPVALEARLRDEVDALGPVRAIVCASRYHHLYAGEWADAYPDAALCACPRLVDKRQDLRFDHVMRDEPHEIWGGDLEQVHFSARFEDEVVFFHTATRTLLCLDALLNLSTHPARSTRMVARLMANTAPGKGYLERIVVGNRARAREQVRRILEWDSDGIVLAHGSPVPRDGREVFAEAYSWLRV
ncbi:MAG: DUF4336 domain-containing protein [Myxococcales bacterium]|nr:DUF4336 domain-containing protein [Myxococcales bacterium]MCB9581596.1 DUF4336 domain-containing protein [Polyangiaceae bacterium]